MTTDLTHALFASLATPLPPRAVAGLFRPPTWEVRRCGRSAYEARSGFAEVVFESEDPILLHGPVGNTEADVDAILGTLRAAGVGYRAEWYDPEGGVLRVWAWDGP